VLIELFSLAITVEALWADICRNFAVWKGVGHFKRKFQGKRGVPHQRFFCIRKLESLGYRRVKKIAEKFNRLSRVHQRYRQTTDGIAIAFSKRNVIRWRLLIVAFSTHLANSQNGADNVTRTALCHFEIGHTFRRSRNTGSISLYVLSLLYVAILRVSHSDLTKQTLLAHNVAQNVEKQ